MLIQLEFNSIKELEEFIARFSAGQGKVSPASSDMPKDVVAGKPDPAPKAPAAPKADAPKDPPAPKTPKAPAAETPKAETGGEISYANDIAPRVLKLAEAKGRDAAIAILSKFGVTKAPQLDAGQYAEFIEAVDAKLAED